MLFKIYYGNKLKEKKILHGEIKKKISKLKI